MTDQLTDLPSTPESAKAQARRLKSALDPDLKISHGQSLELIARVHGEQSWGRLNSRLTAPGSTSPGSDGASTSASAGAAIGPPASPALPANHLNQRALQALSRGLKTARDTVVSSKAHAVAKEIMRDEIIETISIESWLDTLDVNLGGMIFDISSESLLKLSEVSTVSRFQRPKARDKTSYGSKGLKPAAFAYVLIWLERLGFDTHPEVFYEPLLEGIRRATYIDSEELSCLWHSRETKRFSTNEHFIDATVTKSNVTHETVKGRSGLTIETGRSDASLKIITSLRIYR